MLRLTSVCVFLFSALALCVNSGYSLGALVLLLASTWLLWKRPRLDLQRRDYLLLGTLLLYFGIFTANMLYHADPARELDMPLRALLAVPVLLLLLAYPPRPAAWWSGVAIGAIGGAALAFWQLTADDALRPKAATSNAIHFGNVSMLLGMLSLCGLTWARSQSRQRLWLLLMVCGSVAGIAGSIISGSRGGWLALPICTCIIVLHFAKKHGRRYLYSSLAILAVLGTLAFALPHSPVRERTIAAINELNDYKNADDIYSSIGQRFEMWRTALRMSNENLLLGIGRNGYLEQKQALAAEGKMIAATRDFTNAHNDYVDTLVKRGIPGLLALLALFLLPLTLFARALHTLSGDHRQAAQPYALAGVVLLTCYITFGLTTNSLTLNIGIIMLIFPMVILWALLRQQERSVNALST